MPGQVISREALEFMRDLDTPETHGYSRDVGYRVYTEKAVEIARQDGPMRDHHRLPTE